MAGTSNVGPHGGGGGKGDSLAAGLSRRCVARRGWRKSRRKRFGERVAREGRRFGERRRGRARTQRRLCVFRRRFVVLKEKTGRTSLKKRETGEKVCGRKNRNREG